MFIIKAISLDIYILLCMLPSSPWHHICVHLLLLFTSRIYAFSYPCILEKPKSMPSPIAVVYTTYFTMLLVNRNLGGASFSSSLYLVDRFFRFLSFLREDPSPLALCLVAGTRSQYFAVLLIQSFFFLTELLIQSYNSTHPSFSVRWDMIVDI